MAGAAGESVAAEMVLVEAEALDLRAHGAVEDEDALARRRRQRGQHFRAVGLGGDRAEQCHRAMMDFATYFVLRATSRLSHIKTSLCQYTGFVWRCHPWRGKAQGNRSSVCAAPHPPPAPSPRIATGRREAGRDLGSLSAMLEIGEILGDGALLPVTIRGEVPGRAMRGGADIDVCGDADITSS